MDKLPELTASVLGKSLIVLPEVGSTNDYAKVHAAELPHGTAILTDTQTGGKGRSGKAWEIKSGHAMALSVLLHDVAPQALSALPLVIGLGVSLGLERLTGEAFPLKWSNDVLHNEKKICGILCESRMQNGKAFAVFGLGVNLLQTRADLDDLQLVYATSMLLGTGKTYTIFETAAAVLNEIEPLWEKYRDFGFPAVRDLYREHCINLGRQVQVTLDGKQMQGIAQDIAEDGSLVCEVDGIQHVIRAGESSVRGIYGYV